MALWAELMVVFACLAVARGKASSRWVKVTGRMVVSRPGCCL